MAEVISNVEVGTHLLHLQKQDINFNLLMILVWVQT